MRAPERSPAPSWTGADAELLRIAQPGALFAIGINADHYESAGFASWFDAAIAAGKLDGFEIVTSPMYDADRYQAEDAADHAATMSSVALFQRSASGPPTPEA